MPPALGVKSANWKNIKIFVIIYIEIERGGKYC